MLLSEGFCYKRVMGFVHMQAYRKLGDHLPVGTGKEVRYGITLLIFHSCFKYSKVFFFVFESTFLHQKLSWSIQETSHHSESTANGSYDGGKTIKKNKIDPSKFCFQNALTFGEEKFHWVRCVYTHWLSWKSNKKYSFC